MSRIEAVLFDCDSTLVNGEIICSRAYVTMSQEFSVTLDPEGVFKRFKGVKLYEIIDIISLEHGATLAKTKAEHVYHVEVARLFDSELETIEKTGTLLSATTAPMYMVSDSPDNRMQHSIGKLNTSHYFPDKLFNGYDIQRWRPDPALMFHAVKAMNVSIENCIPVDDSVAGAQSSIDAGIEVFYFCTDPHNKPIAHPKVTTFTYLSQLPELWETHGWDITVQFFTLPSLTPLRLALKGKQREFDMPVSRRVIHHGLYFAVLGPLISVLFLVLYILFAKEPLILWVIIHPAFLLLSITTGVIPALLTSVMVVCLPERIRSQKRYRCLAGGTGNVVITEIYCAVIVHIKGMASSELFESALSGDSLVVRTVPALLAGVVVNRIITRLPGLDISCPEADSLN